MIRSSSSCCPGSISAPPHDVGPRPGAHTLAVLVDGARLEREEAHAAALRGGDVLALGRDLVAGDHERAPRELLRAVHHAREVDPDLRVEERGEEDRKSTRLNSSHLVISYAVF